MPRTLAGADAGAPKPRAFGEGAPSKQCAKEPDGTGDRGLPSAIQVQARRENRAATRKRRASHTAPPCRPSPALAPRDPLTMDLTAPALEMPAPARAADQSARSRSRAVAAAAESETRVGKVIEACRFHVTAGVAFVLHGNDAGPPTGDRAWRCGHAGRSTANFAPGCACSSSPACLEAAGSSSCRSPAPSWCPAISSCNPTSRPSSIRPAASSPKSRSPTARESMPATCWSGSTPTQAQASLQMVSKQLDELRARIARLTAERDGLAQDSISRRTRGTRQDDGDRTNAAGVGTCPVQGARERAAKPARPAAKQDRAAHRGDFRP